MNSAHNFIKKETMAQLFSCEFFEIFKNTFFTGTNCARDIDRAPSGAQNFRCVPDFLVRTFCLVKKKTTLDLQVFSRIGKTMKKLL